MASKYDRVLKKLPKLPPQIEDLKFEERVIFLKSNILDQEPRQAVHYATKWAELRREKDELKDALAKIEQSLEAYERLLIDQYDVEGTSSITLNTGENVRVQPEVAVVVEDRESFRIWCLKNGFERELRLWPSTTASTTRALLLKGDPEPDGVRAYFSSKAVLKKA